MAERGANPFIVGYDGRSEFDSLGDLSIIPNQKSVYFTTRPLPDEFIEQKAFPDPWFYKTGVFDGKFESEIGQGAAGTVISGKWFGKRAAFKFVEIGAQTRQEFVNQSLKKLDEKLYEMTSIQSTFGSKIVSFYGHYR